MKRKYPKLKIDYRWFQNAIKRSPFGSQRKVAIAMIREGDKPFDQAALSLTLRGKRKVQLEEIMQLAALLGVSTNEVIERFGVPLSKEKE